MIVSQNDYRCKVDDSDGENKVDDSDGENKNRPLATNFQFLKISSPLGQLLVGACGAPNPARNQYGKLELVGAKPLHLATQDRSVA